MGAAIGASCSHRWPGSRVPAAGGGCDVSADVDATSVSLADDAECVLRAARRADRVVAAVDVPPPPATAEPLLEYHVLPHWLSATTTTTTSYQMKMSMVPKVLTEGWCRRGSGRQAEVALLHLQQPHREGVSYQHHQQRDVEADDGADQLVEWVWNLARAVHKHRTVVLQHWKNGEVTSVALGPIDFL